MSSLGSKSTALRSEGNAPARPGIGQTPYPHIVSVDAKPLLRGWLHVVCFFLAVPVAVAIVLSATSATARVAAVIYGLGVVALFGVSGSYHRVRWSPVWRSRMQRLDHTTIFVTIAVSYTPICLLVLEGWLSVAMLVVAWTGAAVGGILAWTHSRRVNGVRFGLYIALGWAAVLAAPQLVDNLTVAQIVLIAVGGVFFTVGAIFLATNWPDPFPRVFGYHEVWHVLVVAAIACQMVAIASLIHGTGST
jgi:hemolysin III